MLSLKFVTDALTLGVRGEASRGILVALTIMFVWPDDKLRSNPPEVIFLLLLCSGVLYSYVTVCVKSEIPTDVNDILEVSPLTVGVYIKSISSPSKRYPLFPQDVSYLIISSADTELSTLTLIGTSGAGSSTILTASKLKFKVTNWDLFTVSVILFTWSGTSTNSPFFSNLTS